MGQIVKQVSAHTTRYYWYPGDRREWMRGVGAIALGFAGFALIRALTRDTLLAAVVGTSITAALAGLNFGRRDSRELARFGAVAEKSVRRQAVVHTGRAVWRGFAAGTGGAAAAVIIVNLSARGVLADWLLPLVPAAVGALAHQIGMMYERLGTSRATEGPAKIVAEKPTPAVADPASVIPTSAGPAAVSVTHVPAAPIPGVPMSVAPTSIAPVSVARVSATAAVPMFGPPASGVPSMAPSFMAPPSVAPASGGPASAAPVVPLPPVAPMAAPAAVPEPAAGPAAVPAAVKPRATAALQPPMVAHGLVPARAARKVRPPMPASLALLELAEAARAEAAQARREVGPTPPAPATLPARVSPAPVSPMAVPTVFGDLVANPCDPASPALAVGPQTIDAPAEISRTPHSHRSGDRHVGRAKVDA